MEFQRWMTDMRARTALVLFLASIVMGGLLVFALAAVAGDSPTSKTLKKGEPSASAVRWREFEAGVSEAKSSGKPILVDVYTDWCGWCKRMDRDTYSKAEVQRYLKDQFVTVRLNAESNAKASYRGDEYSYRELAGGFRVNSYPTTLFLAPDGNHLATAPGYMGARDFLVVLRYFGDGHYKKETFDAYRTELEGPSEPTPGKE
jgi:thioredoxin-related protein